MKQKVSKKIEYRINGFKIGLEEKLTEETKKLKREIEIDTSKSQEAMSCQEILKKMRYGTN